MAQMRTAEDVFIDFCARRSGILQALTNDVSDDNRSFSTRLSIIKVQISVEKLTVFLHLAGGIIFPIMRFK
jgi:hypothetical protein